MTTSDLYWAIGLYLLVLLIVAFLTRATPRRLAGAFAGGVASGVVAVALDAFGEQLGWWRFAFTWEPYFLALLVICWGVSVTPAFLLSWRMARRFGWLGPAAIALLATVIGPPRDYALMESNPDWGDYGTGWAPVFGIAIIYALLVPVGHTVMWLIAGAASADRLARRPWEGA